MQMRLIATQLEHKSCSSSEPCAHNSIEPHAADCCCVLLYLVLQMKHCASVTLRPRTMDELTKLASMLLVHNLHRFPAMTCLRLELLVGWGALCWDGLCCLVCCISVHYMHM